ncbi:unnamed protein product [Closterium sp. NIES-65]|nr:unnamed protein product [Closterium sp. NIES-65]
MAEGQLPVGDDTLDELGDEFLEDLPDGALPDLRENAAPSAPVSAQPLPSGEPAAKKLCSEGQSSAAGTSGTASALLSAPPPVPRASSSAALLPRPLRLPEPETDHAAAGAITGLAPHARYRNLRRHRTSVGAVLHALTRNTQSMVDVIFPEASSEEVRAAVLTRISALINGQAFNGVIPSFESAAGEALRLPRHTYSRHTFSWPSANDARIFRSLFPVTVRLANNRAMEVKVFSDPNQEFTTARARGDTYVVLRNVPLGYSPERMRSTLLAGTTEAGLPWLFDLRLFHRLKDPYDDSAYSQLLGLPVAADGDAGFDRIPAVLWLPGQEDPVLLNISSHSCSVCSSNHRVYDHACFALTRRARLPNRHTISVAQLQSVNGRLIGQQPAPAAFKKDPGLLLIGIDLDVEVWTCSLCEFECGLALDSAMHHLASDAHRKHLQDSAHLPAVKEKYGAWRAVWRAIFAPALDIPTAAAGTILAGDFNAVCAPEDRNRPLLRLSPPVYATGPDSSHSKKSDATLVDNLRPITLMNTDYKVLAICLANRLQPLLPSLINHSQTAFIKTRRIGDTLNDTLDIFDWATAQSLPLLALTVDIRKAYDMVDRDFLFTCLSHLGLPATFIHWVKLMHSGTTTRISVNNFCGPSIPVITGVRQGCPLAPLQKFSTAILPASCLDSLFPAPNAD